MPFLLKDRDLAGDLAGVQSTLIVPSSEVCLDVQGVARVLQPA